jgi:hypothetical protein
VAERVRSGVPAEQILQLVRGKCIDFAVDAGNEARLRTAGASAELIQGLRGVCTTVKPQPAPAPISPPAPVAPAAEAPSTKPWSDLPPASPSIPTVRSAPSAGGAALKSILIPGLGQLTTGRLLSTWRSFH